MEHLLSILTGFTYILLGAVTLLLMVVILMQDPKSGGLSGAFGMGGGGESIIGAAGQRGIARFTAYLAVLYFALCIIVGVASRVESGASRLDDESAVVGAEGEAEPGGAPDDGGGLQVPLPSGGGAESTPPAGGAPSGGGAESGGPGGAGEGGTEPSGGEGGG